MRGLSRRSCQLHSYFLGSPVALFVIASYTRTDEVLPRIATAPRFRHNVVHCQRRFCCTTILAAAAIATNNITPGQFDLLIGETDICTQPDDAGIRKGYGNCMDATLFPFGNKFGFGKQKQNNCPFYITNANWLIALIEYQDPAVETMRCEGFGMKGNLNWAPSCRKSVFGYETECSLS